MKHVMAGFDPWAFMGISEIRGSSPRMTKGDVRRLVSF